MPEIEIRTKGRSLPACGPKAEEPVAEAPTRSVVAVLEGRLVAGNRRRIAMRTNRLRSAEVR